MSQDLPRGDTSNQSKRTYSAREGPGSRPSAAQDASTWPRKDSSRGAGAEVPVRNNVSSLRAVNFPGQDKTKRAAPDFALLRDSWTEYSGPDIFQPFLQLPVQQSETYSSVRDVLGNDTIVEAGSDDEDSGDVIHTKKTRRHSPTPASANAPQAVEPLSINGPCSNTWKVPPLKPRRKKKNPTISPLPKYGDQDNPNRPKPRGQLLGQDREETALTRQIKACVRCRMQKNRCEPDPMFPTERPCLRCQRLSKPALSVVPCLRYIITDASLYREQAAPTQQFSKRWQSMDIVNIQDWADEEIRVVEISHLFMYAPYKAKMRRFIPQEGDMIEELWVDRQGNIRRHAIPPYAIADMNEHVEVVREFIDRNVGEYIVGLVDKLDPLLWNTYMQAFRHISNAREEREQMLMANAFRFWACCRCTSHEGRLVGEETLGVQIVSDPCSPYYTHIPPPPIFGAQEECIFYTKLLRPLSKNILDELQSMMIGNKKKHWLTIYLTTFILLHSCSMITRRDAETAAKWSLATHYANPESIAAHHMGALTLLAHFHYANKGKKPFALALDPAGLQEVAKSAELLPDEVTFVADSAKLIVRREALMRQVREQESFGHDLYWVSQLYENEWEPSARYVV